MLFDLSTTKDLNQQIIQSTLDEAKKYSNSTIIIPPGTYILTSEVAIKTMNDVINGKYGDNPEPTMFKADFPFSIGLNLDGHDGTNLMAYGVTFLVNGFMEPISVTNCHNVTLKGFTIDHIRKPYSKGIIQSYEVKDTEAKSGSIIVRFDDFYPISKTTIMPRYCVYNFFNQRFFLDMCMTSREFLGNQTFRFNMTNMPEYSLVNQEFYIWHSYHSRPAIMLDESSNIKLFDVTINSQPGMGIVASHCDNVFFERLHVVPSHKENLSTNTDATHFVSCKGNIFFRDCEFKGHGDDAANVHTFYHDFKILDGTKIKGFQTVPTHSLKLDYPDIGDEMQLVDRKTLVPKGTYKVLDVEKNKDYYIATLDSQILNEDVDNCFLADLTRSPFVTFENCTFKNHWARSILLKCRKGLIQNCLFDSSTVQAIHIAPEAAWHEGIACENMVIKNNRFVNCGIIGHCKVGGIKIEISAENPVGQLQKNICIENNYFDLPETDYAISISNAEDVKIKGNYFNNCKNKISLKDCKFIQNEN